MRFARLNRMAVTRQIGQYARGRVLRRVSRSMPWIGAVVAIATIGAAVRRKGLFGGTLDTALDAVPGVGAVKNAFEAIRGRDFIKDKNVWARGAGAPKTS
jgi:hypothetical protein